MKNNLKILFFACTLILILVSCAKKKKPYGTSIITAAFYDKNTKEFIRHSVMTLNDSLFIARMDSSSWKLVIDSVPSGKYKLTIRADGYQSVTVHDFEIDDSQKTHLDLHLSEDWLVRQKDAHIQPEKTATRKMLYVPGSTFKSAQEPLNQNNLAFLKEPEQGLGLDYLSIGGIASYRHGMGNRGYSPYRPGYYTPWWRRARFDTHFKGYEPNAFVKTANDPYSTFGADISTASYTMIRSYIMQSYQLPPPSAVRTEELINYFDMDYDPPKEQLFTVHTDAVPSLINEDCRLLRIGIQARPIAASERKPLNLVLAVDVSGSMGWWDNRFYLLRESMILLSKQLNPGDRIGIVTYGSDARVLIEPTGRFDSVLAVVNQLYASESYTNAEAGLMKAYKLAGDFFRPEAVNHVILCTDGMANKGQTTPAGLLKSVDQYRIKGIYLTACGFGMNTFNDAGLEELATKGDGRYYYISRIEDAQRIFSERFINNFQVAARDVQIQLTFDSSVVREYRLIGYEKRAIADTAFGKADGGEIGFGHHVTALYEIRLKDSLAGRIGNLSLSYQIPGETKSRTQNETVELRQPVSSLANDEMTFLNAVVLFSEILKASPWGKNKSMSAVREALRKTGTPFRLRHPQYENFAEMVYRAIRLTHKVPSL